MDPYAGAGVTVVVGAALEVAEKLAPVADDDRFTVRALAGVAALPRWSGVGRLSGRAG